MKAAVLCAPRRMEIREVAEPRLEPGDVLLEPAVVGLCGTDFHIFSGEANYHADDRGVPVPLDRAPQILGHEITAVVREAGADAGGLRAGDRVVVDQGRNCASRGAARLCEYCDSGSTHQCERYAEHGITGLPGALAERMAVPAVNCIKIESALPLASAAMVEPLACVLHNCDALAAAGGRYALPRLGAPPWNRPVNTVFVAGAGPAGLLFIQVLRNVLEFDGMLILAEPDPAKRAAALRFGASAALDPASSDVPAIVRELTRGRLCEWLIDACGAGALFERAPGLLRKQGTFLLYGHGHGGTSLEALNMLQFRETRFVAACGASGAIDADGRPAVYRRALRLLESGAIDVLPIPTHLYHGLDAVPRAFSGEHRTPGYIKGLAVLSA